MKKFIEKKKLDYKFAKAGAGHSLAETSSSSRPPPPRQSSVRERQHPGQASQLAGTAALSRLDQQSGSGACKPKLRNTTGTYFRHYSMDTLKIVQNILHFTCVSFFNFY